MIYYWYYISYYHNHYIILVLLLLLLWYSVCWHVAGDVNISLFDSSADQHNSSDQDGSDIMCHAGHVEDWWTLFARNWSESTWIFDIYVYI